MQLIDSELCARCRGRGFCKKPCRIYSKLNFGLKKRRHFSGASPPEIFVGRFNYPQVNAGILSPESFENTEEMAFPEIWHEKKFSVGDVLNKRGQLIYGRFKTGIKDVRGGSKFLNLMQEISMAHKAVSTEFFLKKIPSRNFDINRHSPIIGNPAPLESAKLEENPHVKAKVDYLVSDVHCKSVDAINELHKNGILTSNINKILSAGLLGLKTRRRLVPTRWSITAVDDTISKSMLKKIRYYPEISDILLFHSEYNGNHYEILLLPDKFSFEVIEAEFSGGLWNQTGETKIWQDCEFFNGRKKYAQDVTGAYYANRLALCEYLEKIRRQATALFFREVSPEYYAPLGVGILRECCREAFRGVPEKCDSINEALVKMNERFKGSAEIFSSRSNVLEDYGKQKKLSEWI
jgi:DNA repair protein NreA